MKIFSAYKKIHRHHPYSPAPLLASPSGPSSSVRRHCPRGATPPLPPPASSPLPFRSGRRAGSLTPLCAFLLPAVDRSSRKGGRGLERRRCRLLFCLDLRGRGGACAVFGGRRHLHCRRRIWEEGTEGGRVHHRHRLLFPSRQATTTPLGLALPNRADSRRLPPQARRRRSPPLSPPPPSPPCMRRAADSRRLLLPRTWFEERERKNERGAEDKDVCSG